MQTWHESFQRMQEAVAKVLDNLTSYKEQLRTLDDPARRISYSVIESPMGNLESHLATIAVDPEGSGSHVTWSVEVVPDELVALFLPIYEGSVVELKKKIEG